jgi:hypothetical protein
MSLIFRVLRRCHRTTLYGVNTCLKYCGNLESASRINRMAAVITRSLGLSAALCLHADKLSTFFPPDVFHIYDSVLTSMSAVTTSVCLYLLFGCVAVDVIADFMRYPQQTHLTIVTESDRAVPAVVYVNLCSFACLHQVCCHMQET